MVYTLEIFADGGCRGNGQPGSIGAAAIIYRQRKHRYRGARTFTLPRRPTPTNQRAELMAIILALESACDKCRDLNTYPRVDVTIYTDSRYAVDCMNQWIHKWRNNGWIGSSGNPVKNRDLIEGAADAAEDLRERGDVKYEWIPRERNFRADALVNENMDRQMG
ncbi:ribonuclease H-like protein [Aspergillus pseudoustus]|uniref:ribonuclease H n=1 Tax=Aspergillus pseudoustus TaxID=1810923 RepID=A0ABR4J898_9EURO